MRYYPSGETENKAHKRLQGEGLLKIRSLNWSVSILLTRKEEIYPEKNWAHGSG